MDDTTTPVLHLTGPAVAKVRALLDAEGDAGLALRVAVRPGGCSGFAYEMYFDTAVAAGDAVTEFPADPEPVRVVVDASSAQLLTGATLDYRDGLERSGFAVENPNARRTCGCGESFS